MKKSAFGGQQVSSTRLGPVVFETAEPAGTTCLAADLELHRVARRLIRDHVTRLELVQVHEVADVVRQEDGGAVDPRPDRLRVVPHGHVELRVVGALLHRGAEVEGGDGENARELAGTDPRHLAGGAVALGRDLGHGGPLAAEQDGLRVMLVLLVGQGVAPGEHGGEEQGHAEERDADPTRVAEPAHRTDSGRTCPGRGFATPSRAVRSTGSRCICLSLRRPPKTCSVSTSYCPERRSTPVSWRRWSILLRCGRRRAGPRDRRGNGGGPEGRARWRSAVRSARDRQRWLMSHPGGGWVN